MNICCVPVEALGPRWTIGSYWTRESFLDDIKESAVRWIERAEAEQDTAYKQVIPYVLATNGNGSYGCYRRKGTEQRLHGKWSCGIGGHVELCDRSDSLMETVLNGAKREVGEEFVGFDANQYPMRILGVIHEDETDVGLHHIGIVLHLALPGGVDVVPSDELHDFRWVDCNAMSDLVFETWSHLAIELIGSEQCHTH